jgi:hypothetical protein
VPKSMARRPLSQATRRKPLGVDIHKVRAGDRSQDCNGAGMTFLQTLFATADEVFK